MHKDIPKKRYTGDFKQTVIETMLKEGLSYRETARRFDLPDKDRVPAWERIYLEEGAAGLYIERRGRGGARTGRAPKVGKAVEEDLLAEVQRLRAEVDYLKNLDALVRERQRREKKQK